MAYRIPDEVKLIDLILHEIGHECGGHMEHDYHTALTGWAANAVWLAGHGYLRSPEKMTTMDDVEVDAEGWAAYNMVTSRKSKI